MLFPSIFPIIFILLSTPCAVIVVWNVAATVLPPSWKRHFTHFLYFRSLLFRVIYIFKFQLNFEEGERFSPTDYFLKPVLLTSSSGCQTALSSALQIFSSGYGSNCSNFPSLITSSKGRERLQVQPMKRALFKKLPGNPLGVLVTDYETFWERHDAE